MKEVYARDVFLTLSCLFGQPDFVCFSARLDVHYFAVYSVLESFSKL